jgi:hypothetical protein
VLVKRVIMALTLVGGLLALPAPVQAHKGHARPQITRFEFVNKPLKAGTLERLIVVAHDPNSWISEIQIQWEDAEQNGGVIFAHTYCLQDPEFKTPGTPAKLKLDLTFEHPASYHVEARAISEKRCEGGNDTRYSRTLERDIVVKDPTATFTDLDDSSGPLDISSTSHSQYADDAGLKTHITHAVAFFEDPGATPLTGSNDYIRFLFDTDDTFGTFERILTVDAADDGTLFAQMTDGSGTVLREVAVASDGASLSVDFVKGALRRGIEAYRWTVETHDGSSAACSTTACDDRVPDSDLFRHRL